ncbi:hypothetical protein [Streptomyces sp. NPDC002990]
MRGASGAECLDDSGTEVWLVADTYYTYDGDPDKVVDHYWAAAPAAGWKATGSRPEITPGFPLKDMCFRKEVGGNPTLLRVSYCADKEYFVSVNAVLERIPAELLNRPPVSMGRPPGPYGPGGRPSSFRRRLPASRASRLRTHSLTQLH